MITLENNKKSIKNLVTELQKIVNKYGYWSNEVQKFNQSIDFQKMLKINNLVKR